MLGCIVRGNCCRIDVPAAHTRPSMTQRTPHVPDARLASGHLGQPRRVAGLERLKYTPDPTVTDADKSRSDRLGGTASARALQAPLTSPGNVTG